MAPVTPPRSRNFRNARWLGAIAGLIMGAFDLVVAHLVGVSFQAGGRDLTPYVGIYLGGSFGLLGFFLGYAIDARRNALAAAQLIAEAQARLARSEKLATLGQLAAAIAHEVRNPLAIIRSSVQNVAESLPGADEEGRKSCLFITEEIDRLTKVTHALLGFARPLELKPAPIAVRDLFDRTELPAGMIVQGKALRLLRADTPAPLRVEGDSDLLCQALLGLIANAVEATPSGGEVTLEAAAKNGGVELAVIDSGPGVPPELRARIFEPFFTTRPRGHGLGLAVIRQIVEAHGGRIEVGDRPGGGARFALSLRTGAAA